jgi:two-component sensor histidine kinase
MARTHQLLLQHSSETEIDAHIFFTEVMDSLKDSLDLENQGVSLNFYSGIHEIKIDKIIILSLIINELVTNSLKYAFKEQNTAKEIMLKLTKDCSDYLLKYEELGSVQKFDMNKNVGTGMDIIQSLVKQIYGEIDFSFENGLTVIIRFKS